MELMMMVMDGSTLALANASKQETALINTNSTLPCYQNTVAAPFSQMGIGLHSGETVSVTVRPATENTGRFFVRTDQPHVAPIPAAVQSVQSTLMSTELGNGSTTVRTVEHLLAALVLSGVDNARIEIDGPEVPLLDGSAKIWVEAIANVGVQTQSAPRSTHTISAPLCLQRDDAFVVALPAAEAKFTYGIDFPVDAIGNQWHSWSPATDPFGATVTNARTFTLAHQIEQLRKQGLIKGGSLDNALVCDAEKGWLNPPLRFANEPVRHKLLDLLGDLSLMGALPQAHVLAYKASHTLHTEFAKKWLESYDGNP